MSGYWWARFTCTGCPELRPSPSSTAGEGWWCELTGEQLDVGLRGPMPCCEASDWGEGTVTP